MVTLANVVSLFLLIRVFNAEGKRFWDILRFSRETWKTDLLWFIVASVIAMPIVGAPRVPLAKAIFGDDMIATNMEGLVEFIPKIKKQLMKFFGIS